MEHNTFSLSNLGAFRGVSNIVDEKTYREYFDEVCNIILDVMKDHSGPDSSFTIIDDRISNPDRPNFSKDGSDILNSLRLTNPIQDVLRRLIAYVASSSDNAAGDGTTSAVIISIGAMQYLNKIFSEIKSGGKRINYHELKRNYDKFLQGFISFSKENCMTFEKEYNNIICNLGNTSDEASLVKIRRNLIYYIAYSQAFTSSHGDIELSTTVAKLFADSPKESWDYLFFNRNVYEKEDSRFSIKYTEDQFTTHGRIMQKSMLNIKGGNELSYKGAKLISLIHPIMIGHRKYYDAIIDLIKEHVIENKPLVIIHCDGLDDETTKGINSCFEFLKDDNFQNNSVAIIRHNSVDSRLNDMHILNLVAGKQPTSPLEMFNVIDGVDIEYDGSYLTLNNLYENPNDEIVHPFFNNEEFPAMKDFAAVIQESIDKHHQKGPTFTKADDVMTLGEMYHKLKYTKRLVITVGGMVHNSTTAIAVIKDAIYASRSTLNDGFEFGAAETLYQFSNTSPSADNMFGKAYSHGIDILRDSIGLGDDVYNFDYIKPSEFITNNSLEDDLVIVENPMVLQPRTINESLVKRFGDLHLYLLTSSKIISVGGAMIKEEKENANR